VFIKFRRPQIQSRNPEGIIEAGTPALRTADALVTLTDFFAEIVLLYRLWIIWEQRIYVVIFPLIVSLAFVSVAMSTIGILVSHPDAAIAPPSLVPLGTAAFAIPLCFNFMVSSLIVGRIWYKRRQTKFALRSPRSQEPVSGGLVRNAMVICIESGVLYVVVQFVLTVLFAINHPAQIMISDISTQVYGIAPTLIFVRVGLGHSAGSNIFAKISSSQNASFPRRDINASGQYINSPSYSRTTAEHVVIPGVQVRTDVEVESYELKGWSGVHHDESDV